MKPSRNRRPRPSLAESGSPAPRLGRRPAAPAVVRVAPSAVLAPAAAIGLRAVLRLRLSRVARLLPRHLRLLELRSHLVPALVQQHLAARELELPPLVGLQQLDVDAVALVHDVLGVVHARHVQLAYVAQTLDSGEHLHEGSKLENLGDARAAVRLAHLRFHSKALYDSHRGIHVAPEPTVQNDFPVVVDVDGVDLGLLADALDLLAALTDHAADVLLGNRHRTNLGRVLAHLAAGGGIRLLHLAQDVDQAHARAFQRRAHHGKRDALHLDVQLERRQALGIAGDFEIHVAQRVLAPEDVCQDHGRLALGLVAENQTHRDAGDFPRDGHAGVLQRQAPRAHGRHGRRPVALRDGAFQAHGERELLLGGDDGRQRALGEVAVSHLAAVRRADAPGFANRGRREEVVQVESAVFAVADAVRALRVHLSPQRRHCDGLRLAAREQRRAVRARKQAALRRDGAHGVHVAPVLAPALAPDHVSNSLRLDAAARETHVGRLELVLKRFHGPVAHLLHGSASLLLGSDGHRRREVRADRLGDGGVDALGRHEHLLRHLRAADLFRPRLDVLARLRHRLVPLLDGVQHLVDGQEVPEALDHHHRVFRARQHEVQPRVPHLLHRRVDERFARAGRPPHAHAGDGFFERDVGDGRHRARGGDR
mmetsp:Transcript_14208/g.60809  ORF Transcript_14208/g.60809 Transcript_14208/m.60809 type:complete len:653 (-) Transcript_14208:399-2357(-)